MQNAFAQCIATRSLLDLCETAERNQGACVGMWWWEQAGTEFTGARKTEAAAAEAHKDGLE